MSDDALVTPGTLTVALDTSDAPQAMQGADGNLTGYAVDAARALASRMGLKVAFVDASSADSALGDKRPTSSLVTSIPRMVTSARLVLACTTLRQCSERRATASR